MEATDTNDACKVCRDGLRVVLGAVRGLQQLACRFEKRAALRRQLGAACVVPFKQAKVEQLFQLFERLRDRRLRNVEHARSLCDASLFGNGDKIRTLFEC